MASGQQVSGQQRPKGRMRYLLLCAAGVPFVLSGSDQFAARQTRRIALSGPWKPA